MAISPAYSNSLWNQAYNSLLWLQGQTYSSTYPSYAELVQSSLLSAAETVGIVSFINSMLQQSSDLVSVLALPLNLGSSVSALVNRLNSINSITSSLLSMLPPAPTTPASGLLVLGLPSIPYIDYISYFSTYSGEINSDYSVTGPVLNASQWVSASILLQGFYGNQPTRLLDSINENALVAQTQLSTINNLPFVSGNLQDQYTYNQTYSLPCTFLANNIVSLNEALLTNQESLTSRNALLTIAQSIQQTLMIAGAPVSNPPISTTVVYGGETLQDIAARTLGNFELWDSIATLNNIIPGTNLSAGTQLFLPPIAPSGQTAVNYSINVLGRDLNIGIMNEIMPPWTGDFQTIIGINNLIYALCRRLQTTLGTFTFHTDYGSRVPPEVGAVQTINTAAQIGSFVKSSILSDPRIASVSNVGLSSGLGFGTINVSVSAVAIGPNTIPVLFNDVISPLS